MTHSDEWSPEALFDDLADFEAILRGRCAVDLGKGTAVNAAIAHVLDLVSTFNREFRDDLTVDRRHGDRLAVGLSDMARKTRLVQAHRDFDQLCPHFLQFLKTSALFQTVESFADDPSNKLFELVIALSALQFGADVELDHPEKGSSGANPDVLVTVAGTRWGFACKALNARPNRNSYFQSVLKAVDQIERSEATHGFVIVSLRNAMQLDELWAVRELPDRTLQYAVYESLDDLGVAIEGRVKRFFGDWKNEVGEAAINAIFAGKKASPLILNYVNVAAPIMRNGRSVLTTIRMLIPFVTNETLVDPVARDCYDQLDMAVQSP